MGIYINKGHEAFRSARNSDNRYYQIGYMPSVGFTMMGNITLRF
jgi:hypothetical protein